MSPGFAASEAPNNITESKAALMSSTAPSVVLSDGDVDSRVLGIDLSVTRLRKETKGKK